MSPLHAGDVAPQIPGITFGSEGPVGLFFYKVTCPTCQMAAPVLQHFEHAFPGRVVGIGQDPEAALARFAGEYSMGISSIEDAPPYPILRCLRGAVGAHALPDRGGRQGGGVGRRVGPGGFQPSGGDARRADRWRILSWSPPPTTDVPISNQGEAPAIPARSERVTVGSGPLAWRPREGRSPGGDPRAPDLAGVVMRVCRVDAEPVVHTVGAGLRMGAGA